MVTGETYETTRLGLRMSRSKVSAMSKRAGHHITESGLKRLEAKGSNGGRGFPASTLGWLEYLYGLSDPDGMVNWSAVERGAPVLVHGEKTLFSFHAIDQGSITIWGGRHNREEFRTLPVDSVRLVASTALPPEEIAHLYRTRKRGVDSAYGHRILDYMRTNPGPQSVGGLAYTLGIDNMAVSRVAATLSKRGDLTKIQRGVYVLADTGAASVKTALAQRVMARFDEVSDVG